MEQADGSEPRSPAIDAAEVRPLVEVAMGTRPSQVAASIRPAVLFGDDVFDRERKWDHALGQQTAFAAIRRTQSDGPEGRGTNRERPALDFAAFRNIRAFDCRMPTVMLTRTKASYSASSSAVIVPAEFLARSSETRSSSSGEKASFSTRLATGTDSVSRSHSFRKSSDSDRGRAFATLIRPSAKKFERHSIPVDPISAHSRVTNSSRFISTRGRCTRSRPPSPESPPGLFDFRRTRQTLRQDLPCSIHPRRGRSFQKKSDGCCIQILRLGPRVEETANCVHLRGHDGERRKPCWNRRPFRSGHRGDEIRLLREQARFDDISRSVEAELIR